MGEKINQATLMSLLDATVVAGFNDLFV